MNDRGQYGASSDGYRANGTYVGASLVHTLELKQRYDNAKTAAVQALLNDLSRDGVTSSVGTNRWEIALKDGAWVRLVWYPDHSALEVTITDRELRAVGEVDPVRRRYEAILRKVTPQLRTFGATTVGAAVVAGQAPTTDVANVVERGAGKVASGVGDVWRFVKYGAWAVLGIGTVVALSSVVSNLRSGRDPAEKYVELIRSRRSRSSRALPGPRALLALPPGEGA